MKNISRKHTINHNPPPFLPVVPVLWIGLSNFWHLVWSLHLLTTQLFWWFSVLIYLKHKRLQCLIPVTRDIILKEHFTGLTPLHFCAYPKPGPGFQTLYVMVFLMFNDLRSEVIVHFVDHHCLNFLCIFFSIIHQWTCAIL